MKSFKLAILFSALAIAGCGDKNDSDTAQQTLEQAKDMTSSAVESVDQAATSAGESMSDAADAVQEESADAADATAAAADAGMEATADMADQAATATGDAVDAGQDMAADAAAATEETVAAADETAAATTDEAAGAAAIAPAAGADATAGMDLALGKTVYEGKCQACHATGAAGAPKMGDTANWAPRIAQGMDTLFKHSLEGFKGSVGYMPPKGGFTSLSDDEVKAAVAYMVSENQ